MEAGLGQWRTRVSSPTLSCQSPRARGPAGCASQLGSFPGTRLGSSRVNEWGLGRRGPVAVSLAGLEARLQTATGKNLTSEVVWKKCAFRHKEELPGSAGVGVGFGVGGRRPQRNLDAPMLGLGRKV